MIEIPKKAPVSAHGTTKSAIPAAVDKSYGILNISVTLLTAILANK